MAEELKPVAQMSARETIEEDIGNAQADIEDYIAKLAANTAEMIRLDAENRLLRRDLLQRSARKWELEDKLASEGAR